MKKLIVFLFFLLVTSTLQAQDAATVKPKYEYAFVYWKRDSLAIYFGQNRSVTVSEMFFEYYAVPPGGLNGYNPTKGFDQLMKAFDYLEVRGYEFMTNGDNVCRVFNGGGSIPHYIFRKKKLE